MDVDEFLKKSYILGGHCSDCKGFLFTEIVDTNPLSIQQRCLKCGKINDITEEITGGAKTEIYYNSGEKTPKRIIIEPEFSETKKVIEWYKKMITEVE